MPIRTPFKWLQVSKEFFFIFSKALWNAADWCFACRWNVAVGWLGAVMERRIMERRDRASYELQPRRPQRRQAVAVSNRRRS